VFPTKLDPDRKAADNWGTIHGGGVITAGIGGGIGGEGADLLLIDDLIKDAKDAQSETYRDDAWDWFRSTAWMRLSPTGVCAIIGTSWHRDDYQQRAKRELGEEILEICLPAIAEGDDPLGRLPGEALWPEQFSGNWLDAQKDIAGPYYWSALYQQRPSLHEQAEWPAEYFEDIWFDKLPASRVTFRVLALDPSLGVSDKSDYQGYVMLSLGEDGTVYVDADISRRDLTGMVDAGLAICSAFQPHAWALESNGFLALEQLVVERSKGVMPPIASVRQHKNKVARVRLGVGPYLAHHKLRFNRASKGAAMLVEQLKDFPIGDYDDGPDALEMGLRVLREVASTGGIRTPTLPQMVTA
jgi:predicted phage terminase large subunit-like protein